MAFKTFVTFKIRDYGMIYQYEKTTEWLLHFTMILRENKTLENSGFTVLRNHHLRMINSIYTFIEIHFYIFFLKVWIIPVVRTGLKCTWIYRTVLKCPWKLNLPWKVVEKHSKALKSPWILPFSGGFNFVFGYLNQYKIVVPLFGAAYAAPNKGIPILY